MVGEGGARRATPHRRIGSVGAPDRLGAWGRLDDDATACWTTDRPPWPMGSSPTGSPDASSSACVRTPRTVSTMPGSVPVGGLPMSQDFAHLPVMVDEVVDLLAPVPAGVVIDATVGGGGHAAAVLSAHAHLAVLGLDQDTVAVEAATARLAGFGARAVVRQARFDSLDQVAAGEGSGRESVSAVLFDLGVSSVQLDRPDRGFSYRFDAPLDMRMDQSTGPTAAILVNTLPEASLAALFAANGEGRLARRIAAAVVAARPLSSTGELADVVAQAVPAPARRRGHPARRVFQALRIAVNDELQVLALALPQAIDLLVPGGRCIVISYHSGEDRLVKAVFVDAATGGCQCPPALPCACGAVAKVRLLNRGARKPSASEVAANHRAESARLRAVERLAPGEAP